MDGLKTKNSKRTDMEDVNNLDAVEKIKTIESKNKQLKICYGGDGTILQSWRDAHSKKKILFPIRNYSQCDEHKTMLDDILSNPTKFDKYEKSLKMTLHPLIECSFNVDKYKALSEFTITNKDVTSAIRFDCVVNGDSYYENIISTGIIVATAFGSTGYFTSVARTNFRIGVGVAFIAPTVGINNIILSQTDRLTLVFRRESEIIITADKEVYTIGVGVGDKLEFVDACDNVAIIGRKQFMCAKCRKNRNSTILNNSYLTV